MKSWPDSRPEVFNRLETLCDACRDARADLERLGQEWANLNRTVLGPTYAPVQEMLERVVPIVESLAELEQAAIRAVQGETYTDEEEDARFGAIYEAMGRCLKEKERQVYELLYLEKTQRRRISWVDNRRGAFDYEDMTEEERNWYGDTSWTKEHYHVPHKATQQEVAAQLGISQSMVSKLAKSASAKMNKEIGWLE
jgi:hypothetical protein